MKKVILAAAVIAALGLVSVPAVQAKLAVSTQQTAPEFTKIETAALPQAVTEALARDYKDSTVKEAFENKEAKLYKVVIKAGEKEETVIYNDKGEAQEELPAQLSSEDQMDK